MLDLKNQSGSDNNGLFFTYVNSPTCTTNSTFTSRQSYDGIAIANVCGIISGQTRASESLKQLRY